MIENKEVKIAIVVSIIMVTICLLAFIFTKSSRPKNNTIDFKVYKLYDKLGTIDEHEYRACKITTDDLITIRNEYRKAEKLDETSKVSGKQITGKYKIIYEDTYIAFDAEEEPLIYRSDVNALFKFDSDLYEYIKTICD